MLAVPEVPFTTFWMTSWPLARFSVSVPALKVMLLLVLAAVLIWFSALMITPPVGTKASAFRRMFCVGWSAAGSFLVWTAARFVTGGRVSKEVEFEGVDYAEHGEVAYHS